MLNVISLGAGVQSSTMALMAAAGEITPMPDLAIFADTQAEPQSVYDWLNWLETQLPFPVRRATYGNLEKDNLDLRRSKKTNKLYSRSLIPAFIRNVSGTKGILPRKCTRDYKINVIARELRKVLGKRAISSKSPLLVTSWIGISFDESERMKKATLGWIENRWPLVNMGMTREDCLEWMEQHKFPRPPRSACVFCPYHSDREWLRLKNDEPAEFARAVAFEKSYTQVIALDEVTNGTPFLHDSLVPLDQVKFEPEKRSDNTFQRECEGMCGL